MSIITTSNLDIDEERFCCKICYTKAFNNTSYLIILCSRCHYLYCESCFRMIKNKCSYCGSSNYITLNTRNTELQSLLNMDPLFNVYMTLLRYLFINNKKLIDKLKNDIYKQWFQNNNLDLKTSLKLVIENLKNIKYSYDKELLSYKMSNENLKKEIDLVMNNLIGLEKREKIVLDGEKELRQLSIRESKVKEQEELISVRQNSLESHEKELKERENRLLDLESQRERLYREIKNYNKCVEDYNKSEKDLANRISKQYVIEKENQKFYQKLQDKENELKNREEYLTKQFQELDNIKNREAKLNQERIQLQQEVSELAKTKMMVYDLYCKMYKGTFSTDSLSDSQKEILSV